MTASKDQQQSLPGLELVSENKPKKKDCRLTRREQRLLTANHIISEEETPDITFQHTIFCQTCMPYRNPGDDVRIWERQQGQAHLLIKAGEALHPEKNRFVDVGLPFGPKPRLILAYLNTHALRAQSPHIEVEYSLTAFVKRIGLHSKGQNMRIIKDQLTRLSASDFRLGLVKDGYARTLKATIISGFELWFPKNERQRVLWPTTITFSVEYFESLCAHAVPLNEMALANLSHNAMAIDIYSWLAQRLHRVPRSKTQLVPWICLMEQFGYSYKHLYKFRQVFKSALSQVLVVYPEAHVELIEQGMEVFNSPPPVLKRFISLRHDEN